MNFKFKKINAKKLGIFVGSLTVFGTLFTISDNNVHAASNQPNRQWLEQSIKKASAYSSQYWTASTYQNLQNNLGKAKRVDHASWVNQKQVNSATNNLNTAMNGMHRDIMNGSRIVLPSSANGKRSNLNPATLNNPAAGSGFYASKLDQNTYVNYANLSYGQQLELSSYAARLINGMRSQLGNQQLQVSPTAMSAATQVANRYNADKWNMYAGKGHDIAALKAVMCQYKTVPAYSEDMVSYGGGNSAFFGTSMASLKSKVYQSIQLMVFNDAAKAYGHTKSILGLSTCAYITNTPQSYLGVSFDKLGGVHFEIIANNPNFSCYTGKVPFAAYNVMM